jgi:hypothetical protein
MREGSTSWPIGDDHYSIGPLVEGAYDVQAYDGINPPVRPPAFTDGPVAVRSNETVETVISLDRSGRVRGHVVDDRGRGEPNGLVSVDCSAVPETARSLTSPQRRKKATRRPVVADGEGRFEIDGLESGVSCKLRAESSDGAVGTRDGVRPGDEVTIALAHGLGKASPDRNIPARTDAR